MHEYRVAPEGSERRSYKYLYDSAKAVIERDRRERARKDQVRKPALPASTGNDSGVDKRKQTLCYFIQVGKCKLGDDCAFSHDPATAKFKAEKPGMRARSDSRGSGGAVCRLYLKGLCDKGRNCKYSHDVSRGTSVDSRRGKTSPAKSRSYSNSPRSPRTGKGDYNAGRKTPSPQRESPRKPDAGIKGKVAKTDSGPNKGRSIRRGRSSSPHPRGNAQMAAEAAIRDDTDVSYDSDDYESGTGSQASQS